MMLFLQIALAVLVVAGLSFAVASVLAARTLVARHIPRLFAFELVGESAIRLPATALTVLPGTYGLFYDGNRGHARIGAILDSAHGKKSIVRALETVTGTPIPRRGKGQWVRDVYPSPAALGLTFEEVEILSDAGVCPAWVIPPSSPTSSAVWAIHLHGIRSTRSVVLPSVAALSDLDITSLVPSWRGDTEGPATASGASSLGQDEWRDVELALAFAFSSGAESVILIGWSMGATIARLLVARSRFADRIAGMVLVAPVTSWRAVVAHAARSAHLPTAVASAVEVILANPALCRLTGLSKPISLNSFDVDVGTPRSTVSTLMIHNPDDEKVPFGVTTDFARRHAESTALVVFEGSPHAMEWNREPERFESTLYAWVVALLTTGPLGEVR